MVRGDNALPMKIAAENLTFLGVQSRKMSNKYKNLSKEEGSK